MACKRALLQQTPTRPVGAIRGRRPRIAISADTALRLARFFGMSEDYWLNRQMQYDLECARMELGRTIEKAVTPLARL